MNEKPRHDGKDKAMEGRFIDANGTDHGDAAFHEVGWGTTPDAARADLERMAAQEVELAENQAEAFAQKDPSIGAKAYRSLSKLYPQHPNRPHWEERVQELEVK